MATCQQDVVVIDNEDPEITCPGTITIDADAGECFSSAVMLGTPSVSDNCPGVSFTNNAPATFTVGTTAVTWTATDMSGNMITCSQNVIVEDNELPTITCPPSQIIPTDLDYVQFHLLI